MEGNKEMFSLAGKVALITGGARGIGKEIALKLAQQGAHIVLCDVLDEVVQTAKEIETLGRRAIGLKADITKIAAVDEMVEKTLEAFSQIDILINNAGITRDNLLVRMSEAEWDLVLNVNLKGTFNCLKAVAKVMMKQRAGKIVNVASVVGVMGNASQANYAASKGGVISLTKSVAKELASRNINVNAIAPGYIETDMTKNLPEKAKESFLSNIPLKRAGTATDIANVVAFLVSEEASYITGQVIHIDGGLVM
jgi:3-oxoacyl-[acyl-carrier protein] reductase